jgi:hypothetical protein
VRLAALDAFHEEWDWRKGPPQSLAAELTGWKALVGDLGTLIKQIGAKRAEILEALGGGRPSRTYYRVSIVTGSRVTAEGKCPDCGAQIEESVRVPGNSVGTPTRAIPLAQVPGDPTDAMTAEETAAWQAYMSKLERDRAAQDIAHAKAAAAERPAAAPAAHAAAQPAADVPPVAAEPAPSVVVSTQPERVQRTTGAPLTDPRNPLGGVNPDYWQN